MIAGFFFFKEPYLLKPFNGLIDVSYPNDASVEAHSRTPLQFRVIQIGFCVSERSRPD